MNQAEGGAPVKHHTDSLAPARGIFLGVASSTILWALVALTFWRLHS